MAGTTLCALLALAGVAGARFNLTDSLPPGLYWTTGESIARGSYIRFCPPATGAFAEGMQRGYLRHGRCPGGSAPMLKRVSGVAGDVIDVDVRAIQVNGMELPLSEARVVDGMNRPLPRPDNIRIVLDPSRLWVMSDTNRLSFDSRYFGPIDESWVRDVVRPVLTWGHGGTLEREAAVVAR